MGAAAEADVSVVIQVTSTTTLNDRIQRLQDCHRDLTSFFFVSFDKKFVRTFSEVKQFIGH